MSKYINRLLEKPEGYLDVKNIESRNSLTIFNSHKWENQIIQKSWDNSSVIYLHSKKLKLNDLNEKQILLVYFILSIFKDKEQFNNNHNYYKVREQSIEFVGNNYLKARFSLLPKIPEHLLGLTIEDLSHSVFKEDGLLTDNLSLPYLVKLGNNSPRQFTA